jgi:2-dehydropantoate 2-reductase
LVRVIMYGAGAVGGVIGARLFQAGQDVTLVARGEHYRAIRANGLRLEAPGESVTLRVPVVESVAELDLGADDVVVLGVKSQDTRAALAALADRAAPSIVCAQNGVENERQALRLFRDVYGMCVICFASHLAPGVVGVNSAPITGLLDLGRWPRGVDERSRELAAALGAATFESVAREDIARWKYAKLLRNLGNAVEALCGPAADAHELARRARAEGERVFDAAGIDYASAEEDAARRRDKLVPPPGADTRGGGSTWQSLARGVGSVETDYLNGEIVLLGRLHGVATPVNELLQRLVNQLAFEQAPPGTWIERDVLAMLH